MVSESINDGTGLAGWAPLAVTFAKSQLTHTCQGMLAALQGFKT